MTHGLHAGWRLGGNSLRLRKTGACASSRGAVREDRPPVIGSPRSGLRLGTDASHSSRLLPAWPISAINSGLRPPIDPPYPPPPSTPPPPPPPPPPLPPTPPHTARGTCRRIDRSPVYPASMWLNPGNRVHLLHNSSANRPTVIQSRPSWGGGRTAHSQRPGPEISRSPRSRKERPFLGQPTASRIGA